MRGRARDGHSRVLGAHRAANADERRPEPVQRPPAAAREHAATGQHDEPPQRRRGRHAFEKALIADRARDVVPVREVLDRVQQQREQHAAQARAGAGQQRDGRDPRERPPCGRGRGSNRRNRRSAGDRVGHGRWRIEWANGRAGARRERMAPSYAPGNHETNGFFFFIDEFNAFTARSREPCPCRAHAARTAPPFHRPTGAALAFRPCRRPSPRFP
ncbi:conserved hypothetical protein [Burkholderia pseudomallei Pakistan 9]|nr:conserved hypothetical protein [Burkholderia pseudomallei Pakistan 9]